MDPRSRAPGDPDLLRTYGGVLPGMTPVVPMDDESLAVCGGISHAAAYEVPDDTARLFAPGRDDRAPGQSISGAASAWPTQDNAAGFLT